MFQTQSPVDSEQRARDLVARIRTLPDHRKLTTSLNNVGSEQDALVRHAHSSTRKAASFLPHSIVGYLPLRLWSTFRRLRRGLWVPRANIGA
jgi:hypothetical protein